MFKLLVILYIIKLYAQINIYVIINNVNCEQSEYFKQINGNKYLTLLATYENEEKIIKI